MGKKLTAEFLGTFWLVLGGCGSAVLAAAFPNVGIGLLGVSLAFGLTLLTMVYTIGPVSGCHINPAVSIGLWAGGRFPASSLIPYILAQVAGGIAGAGVLYLIASGKAGFDLAARLRVERLRRALPGRLLAWRVLRLRGRDDVHVPDHHPRRHRQAGAGRLRRDRHRPRPDADPSRQHPGDEHLGQSGPQHRARALRRRLGRAAAVALLARADRRRRDRGHWSTEGCSKRGE